MVILMKFSSGVPNYMGALCCTMLIGDVLVSWHAAQQSSAACQWRRSGTSRRRYSAPCARYS